MWLNTPTDPDKKASCLILIIIIVTMKVISVSVTLCTILTLSRALPLNTTLQTSLCVYERQNCTNSTGAYCPQCDANGSFLPQQCSGSTGYCWCVNITSGQEIPNTRKPPGTVPDCGNAVGRGEKTQTLPTETSPVCINCGHCKYERQNCSSGAFCPKCDTSGNFLPKQCSWSTGFCWCVNVISGKLISNTTVPPGAEPDCDNLVGNDEKIQTLPTEPGPICVNCGHCKYERQNCSNATGAFCPKCDAYGNFLPKQCLGSSGFCWCVDVMTGKKIPNTTSPPGTEPDCSSGEKMEHLPTEPDPICVNCDSGEKKHPPREPGPACVNCGNGTDSREELQSLLTEPDGDVGDCPDGWSKFGKRCFIFIDSPKTWIDAEIYCQFDKANLASIHSHHENRFIMSLTRGDTHNFPQTWLGGFDAIHPGYWMWSDGSEFSYKNWYDNEHDKDHDNGDSNQDNNDDHYEHSNDNHDRNNHDNDQDNHDDYDHDNDQDNNDDSDNENHDDHDSDQDNNDDENHDDYDDSHHDRDNHDDHNKHYNDRDEDNHNKKKNCLRMNYEYNLKWFYASCRESLPFVCAKSI